MSNHRWIHSEQDAISYLLECGCPREFLDPVKEWAQQHVVSSIDLERWRNRDGIYGGMWFQKQAAGEGTTPPLANSATPEVKELKTYEVEFQLPYGCRMAYVEATNDDDARQQVLDNWPLARIRGVCEMSEAAGGGE